MPLSQNSVEWIRDSAKVLIYQANFTKKISDFTDTNDYADLVKLITEWRMHLGIKDEITQQELEFNAKYIKEEYSHFTLEKIRLAIKYSLKGELKVDIVPYGAFSPLYISRILNAYEKYDNKIVSDILREKDRKEQDERNKPAISTEEQKIGNRIQYLFYYQKECKNGVMTDFKGIMWDFLLKQELVHESLLERIDLKERAYKELERMGENGNWIQIDELKVDHVVKYYIMSDFFSQNTLDFSTYTKEELL